MTYDVEDAPPARAGLFGLVRRFAGAFIVVGVIIAGIVGYVVLMETGPRAQNRSEPPAPPSVQVADATREMRQIGVFVQGEVNPKTASSLAAQVAGRVVWVSPSFSEGGAFRAGDVLVRVDDADYRLGVVRGRAQVAQAREALAREEAEAELAKRDWEALGKGEASPLALREPQLAQAKAALAAAEAQLQDAELQLARTSVRAPFAGRVRARRVNVGDYLAPGAPVVDAFATDVMEVRVALSDADLAQLSMPLGFIAPAGGGPAAKVTATIAGAAQTWTGRLVRVDANIDARTRQVFAVVEVPSAFRGATPLAPGLFANVELGGGREETFVIVPRSALKRNEFIYVVKADGTIDIRNVRPAQTSAEAVYLREGVAPGEKVVTSALTSPRQGMRVSPIDAQGKPVPVVTAPTSAG